MFCVLCGYNVMAQNENCSGIVLNTFVDINTCKTFRYNPKFKAKQIYIALEQVKNEHPEQLMSSILSAKTGEWIAFNNGTNEVVELSKERIKAISSRDTSKIFYELDYKIEFKFNGEKYCFIKFNIIYGTESIRMVESMKYASGRWIRVSNAEATSFSFYLQMIKSDYLDLILNDEKQIKEQILKDLYKESICNNTLNLSLLFSNIEKKVKKEGIESVKFMIEPQFLNK